MRRESNVSVVANPTRRHFLILFAVVCRICANAPSQVYVHSSKRDHSLLRTVYSIVRVSSIMFPSVIVTPFSVYAIHPTTTITTITLLKEVVDGSAAQQQQQHAERRIATNDIISSCGSCHIINAWAPVRKITRKYLLLRSVTYSNTSGE